MYGLIFANHPHEQILNRLIVYVESYTNLGDIQGVELTKIVKFSDLDISGQMLEANIVPMPEQKFRKNWNGVHEPNGNGLIINQRAATIYQKNFQLEKREDLLNKEIFLQIKTKDGQELIPFTIQGFVEETDIDTTMQMYYNKNGLDSLLKKNSIYDKAY